MLSACVFYLAFAWAVPSTGCDVPVQFVAEPPAGVRWLGGVDPRTVAAYSSAEGVTLLPAALPYLRHALAHEMAHYRRIKARTLNYDQPFVEEWIATQAACAEAPEPWCGRRTK